MYQYILCIQHSYFQFFDAFIFISEALSICKIILLLLEKKIVFPKNLIVQKDTENAFKMIPVCEQS